MINLDYCGTFEPKDDQGRPLKEFGKPMLIKTDIDGGGVSEHGEHLCLVEMPAVDIDGNKWIVSFEYYLTAGEEIKSFYADKDWSCHKTPRKEV